MLPAFLAVLVGTVALTGAPAAGAADAAQPLGKGASCLAGTWTLNLINSPAGVSGATTSSEGSVTLQFGPGRTFTQTYAVTVTTGQPGPNGTYLQAAQQTQGTVDGDYSATPRKLTLTHVHNDTSAVSTVSVDQRTTDPATETPAPETFPAKKQTVAYRCSGDTLRLNTGRGLTQGYTRTG